MPEREYDPWRTLGVPIGARPPEIRRAFRRLARRMHPDVSRDKARAHEQFIQLRQAYETLCDDDMRAALEDRALREDTEPLIIVDDFEVTLGDAYELVQRGYVAEARDVYLELSREQPGDPRLLELLEAIHEAEGQSAGTATRTEARVHERYRDLWQPEPVVVRWWLVGLAAIAMAGCIVAVRLLDAPPAIGPYALKEIALAALAGFLGTALVAASGAIGAFDLELGEYIGDSRFDVPMWLYLAVAGVVSPLLALVFYAVFVALQSVWSWSVAGFFAGVFALAVALAFTHGGGVAEALLPGSNVVFLPALIGWAVGSIFRPGYWWE